MLGVQLYTLRKYLENDNDIKATAKKLKEMGCECVQLFHGDARLESICDIFSSEGINIIGTLSSLEVLEGNPELFRVCEKYGLKDIGISCGIIDESEVDVFIPRVNAFAKKVKENGFTFSYHNHANEFTRLPSGKTVMDRYLCEFSEDVTLMPDTYWLQTGGVDVREWIELNGSRTVILHLKDLTVHEKKPTFAPVGQGNINFTAIINTARARGIDNFIIEQDICLQDPFECVKMSMDFLRDLI